MDSLESKEQHIINQQLLIFLIILQLELPTMMPNKSFKFLKLIMLKLVEEGFNSLIDLTIPKSKIGIILLDMDMVHFILFLGSVLSDPFAYYKEFAFCGGFLCWRMPANAPADKITFVQNRMRIKRM